MTKSANRFNRDKQYVQHYTYSSVIIRGNSGSANLVDRLPTAHSIV